MSKVAVFVDITDLYYKLLRKYKNGKLNYQKYLSLIKEMNFVNGNEIEKAIAYGCQTGNEASSFIGYLRSLGFITKYKKPFTLKIEGKEVKRCNWLVGITVDAFNMIGDVDEVVLGLSNPDAYPLIKCLEDRGIKVTIFSCSVPNSLAKVASNVIEITEDLLEDGK